MTVNYPSHPLTQLQPDRFAVQAALRGLAPTPPSRARVLEIGCSDAENLFALAAYAPGATFLGVDIDADAVAAAQRHALPNLRVEQADLAALDVGRFDYVIAHGVLSWVPDPGAVFACVARHLAPDGIGYLSYDTLPGSHIRAMASAVLRRESAGDLDRAREVMRSVIDAEVDSDNARVMQLAMGRVAAKPDHVVRNDELQAVHTPLFFDEFVSAAARHGLRYLGEAHLADAADQPGLPGDVVRAEQWSDYLTNRQYRQSLLTWHEPGPVSLPDLWVSAPGQRTVRGVRRLLNGIEVQADDPDVLADLDLLGRTWPAAVRVTDLRGDPRAILRLYRARAIDLRSEPVAARTPGARPRVVAAMRNREYLTTCRHEPLRLEDDASRQAVAMMDGSRTRDEIAAALGASRVDLDGLIEALGRAGLFVG
ncbi:MAG: methyltransferase [Candidatus Nanopelagicales bacterium]